MAAANWVERRRLLIYPALMGLGVGMLASCAEKPPPVPPRTVAVEPPPPPLPPPPPRRLYPLPARKPMPPADTAALAPEVGSPALALGSPAPASPPPDASELIGLDQPAATHLLGEATEQSEAPPATIWRYRSATCELDLFFYLDLRSGKMRTLHYSFKGETGDPAARQDCLRSLIVARGG